MVGGFKSEIKPCAGGDSLMKPNDSPDFISRVEQKKSFRPFLSFPFQFKRIFLERIAKRTESEDGYSSVHS